MKPRPTLQYGPGLHYSLDLRIQTYTEPISLKCGKLATKYPWIYRQFYSAGSAIRGPPARLFNMSILHSVAIKCQVQALPVRDCEPVAFVLVSISPRPIYWFRFRFLDSHNCVRLDVQFVMCLFDVSVSIKAQLHRARIRVGLS